MVGTETKSHATTQKEVLQNLRLLGGKGIKDEDIIHEGTKFILPQTMTTAVALKNLQAMVEAQSQKTNFTRTFKYRPWDGAYATFNVLKQTFGSLGSKSEWSMFGEKPPQIINFEIGPGVMAEVPWGILTIGAIPDIQIRLGGQADEDLGQLFNLTITGPKSRRFEAEGIFHLVDEELKTNSIYRGKAIDGGAMPSFLDLNGVDPKRIVYSEDVLNQLNASVWSLIERTDNMRMLKLPLKRAILIEGEFGTGKTLAAFLTAQRCVQNKWTFLYARPAKDDLAEVMRTARLYQPAVVFMEDMDTVPGARDTDDEGESSSVSQMLDLFDGINAKSTEIIAILTTNYIDRITKGMLRPGRLDAIIHIAALDRVGIRRLLEANVDEALRDPDINWNQVADAAEGFMPAFVKEMGDRAIRYALARGIDPDKIKLITEDFVGSANGLRPQLELMNRDKTAKVDTLEEAMVRTFQVAHNKNGGPKMEEQIEEIHDQVING